MKQLKVLVVDDNDLFRKTAVSHLKKEKSFSIVGEGKSYDDALSMVEELRPDVAVLDVRMPGEFGLKTIGRLKKSHPNLVVIILTLHDSEQYRTMAFDNGADRYILKINLYSELIPAIQNAVKEV